MKISPFHIAFACAFLLNVTLSGSAYAKDFAPSCPDSIDVQQSIKKTPDGWAAGIYGGGMDNVKYRLTNVQFSDGDPSGYAWLVPDAGKKMRKIDRETWNFPPNPTRGFWITCEYALTSVTLTKRLPDDVKSCTVDFDTSFAEPEPVAVHCK